MFSSSVFIVLPEIISLFMDLLFGASSSSSIYNVHVFCNPTGVYVFSPPHQIASLVATNMGASSRWCRIGVE
ncbi:hypothetical protein C5167_033332 [Papaver somniferum]|uniref:Secreted protein n=1 Tax=Papaver somniferum TaxID=3469 RepID=A0A4Y7K9J6_PAPSO|nr:hypothetical protein C5167_033332 [Papaver somniferum]